MWRPGKRSEGLSLAATKTRRHKERPRKNGFFDAAFLLPSYLCGSLPYGVQKLKEERLLLPMPTDHAVNVTFTQTEFASGGRNIISVFRQDEQDLLPARLTLHPPGGGLGLGSRRRHRHFIFPDL